MSFVSLQSGGTGAALKGGARLERMLKGLEKKDARKIVRSAVTQGIKIPMRAMKSNAVSMVGGEMGALINSNIQSRAFKRQRPGSFARFLSLKPNVPGFIHRTKDGQEYYIPAQVEFGHDDVAPIPFMRAAADSTRAKTIKRTSDLIIRGILKHAKKAM
ncbi:MAG TPA: hypothetical protein ENH94_04240 [Phycisphaerales bacterium]|nr:hypothetical protein [Phycisphaerales bacterium]